MKSRPKDLVFKGKISPKYAFLTQSIQVIQKVIPFGPEVLSAKHVDRPRESRPKYRSVAP